MRTAPRTPSSPSAFPSTASTGLSEVTNRNSWGLRKILESATRDCQLLRSRSFFFCWFRGSVPLRQPASFLPQQKAGFTGLVMGQRTCRSGSERKPAAAGGSGAPPGRVSPHGGHPGYRAAGAGTRHTLLRDSTLLVPARGRSRRAGWDLPSECSIC